MKQVHTIDAQGKRVGRVASEAVSFLRGKHSPDFAPHKTDGQRVHIINAKLIDIISSKLKNKIYTRYTGYPGGLRRESLENVIVKKGHTEIVRRAVYGMLPNNKLRSIHMKHLMITD